MSSLWVPPKVSRELQAETDAHRAQIMAVADRGPVMERFNEELRRMDPYLELIWWPPNADHVAGMVPGAYHVLRNAPGAPPMVEPVTDEAGNPIDPTSRLFDRLRESDLWNEQAVAARREIDRKADDARRRMQERENEERREEIRERIDAVTRASVSMNDSTPWTQTATATRAAGEAKKKAA